MPSLAIAFPMIDPVLLHIGPFALRWYALAYVAGLIGGWWVARRLISNEKLWGGKPPLTLLQLDDMLVAVAFGVVLGGRLGYVLFYNGAYYLQNPLEALAIWHGGMSFHGGLMGALGGILIFARWHGLTALPLLDLASTVAPIGLFFGRIANFINGELWGRVTDVPWAIVFPAAGPEPRHPSQLYQAGLEGLVLGLILFILVKMGGLKRPGLVAGTFGLGYGAARMVGELFRQPDVQIGFLPGGLTMGMVLSAPVLLAGLALMIRAHVKG